MIKLVKAKEPYPHDHGDLNWGANDINVWLSPMRKLPTPRLPLLLAPNPWESLILMGVDARDLCVRYECGVTGLEFWAVVPIGIYTVDVRRYRPDQIAGGFYDYYYDLEWHKQMNPDVFGENYLPDISRVMLGTGYTSFCRPSDGSKELTSFLAQLDNGDHLHVKTWMWYNK